METLCRVETLYSQSRDTIQSVWKHYSQNENTIRIGDTVQSSVETLCRVETIYSLPGDTKKRVCIPAICSLITVPLRLYNNSEYHKWHTHTHTHTHTLCGQNAKFCKVKTHAVNNFCLSLKGPLCGQQMKSTLQNKYQQLYYPLNTEAVSSSETLIHTNVKGHNLRIYLSENLKL